MKTYLYKGVVLASLLLPLCFTGKAQTNAGVNHDDISIQLSSKADMDCMQSELLNDMANVSLVYANPHSGIMILKSDSKDEKSLLTKINDCISDKKETIRFEVLETSGTYYLSRN